MFLIGLEDVGGRGFLFILEVKGYILVIFFVFFCFDRWFLFSIIGNCFLVFFEFLILYLIFKVVFLFVINLDGF